MTRVWEIHQVTTVIVHWQLARAVACGRIAEAQRTHRAEAEPAGVELQRMAVRERESRHTES